MSSSSSKRKKGGSPLIVRTVKYYSERAEVRPADYDLRRCGRNKADGGWVVFPVVLVEVWMKEDELPRVKKRETVGVESKHDHEVLQDVVLPVLPSDAGWSILREDVRVKVAGVSRRGAKEGRDVDRW